MVGVIEVGLAGALLDQRLVDGLAMAIAGQEAPGAVIDVAGDNTGNAFFDAPAERVVAVLRRRAAGKVDAKQLVEGVVAVAGGVA